MNLLADFINSRQKEYVEPVRKGTPRDEERGLTRPKYKMALLALTNLSTKKIAAKCGTTTERVINYRRRPGFQRVVKEETKRFSQIFTSALTLKARELEALPSSEEKYSPGYYDDLYQVFVDCSQALRIQIINSIKSIVHQQKMELRDLIQSKKIDLNKPLSNPPLSGVLMELYRLNLIRGRGERIHRRDREENENILKTQLEIYKLQVAETHEFILIMLERYDQDMKESLKDCIAYEKGLRDAISSIQEELGGISKEKK